MLFYNGHVTLKNASDYWANILLMPSFQRSVAGLPLLCRCRSAVP